MKFSLIFSQSLPFQILKNGIRLNVIDRLVSKVETQNEKHVKNKRGIKAHPSL